MALPLSPSTSPTLKRALPDAPDETSHADPKKIKLPSSPIEEEEVATGTTPDETFPPPTSQEQESEQTQHCACCPHHKKVPDPIFTPINYEASPVSDSMEPLWSPLLSPKSMLDQTPDSAVSVPGSNNNTISTRVKPFDTAIETVAFSHIDTTMLSTSSAPTLPSCTHSHCPLPIFLQPEGAAPAPAVSSSAATTVVPALTSTLPSTTFGSGSTSSCAGASNSTHTGAGCQLGHLHWPNIFSLGGLENRPTDMEVLVNKCSLPSSGTASTSWNTLWSCPLPVQVRQPQQSSLSTCPEQHMHMPDSGFAPAQQAAAPVQDLGGAAANIDDLDTWLNLGQAATFGSPTQNILPECQTSVQDELFLDMDAEAWAHLAGLI